MIACAKGSTNLINILLNAGANPNNANVSGLTCIHIAVFGGCSQEILETMINHGADVNVPNMGGRTPLMLACKKENIRTINVLLNAGANPHISDDSGDTCLHYAVNGVRSEEALDIIISHGVDVNAVNKNIQTALMIACDKRRTDLINILLNARANPNITDADGFACIHHMVVKGCSKEALETIIKHGASVNASNRNNETALLIACKKGNMDNINVLLNAGANIRFANDDGDTCLHYAVDGKCSKEVLEMIISHGADVNATNKDSITVLMAACGNGRTGLINLLLNAGANPNINDADGFTCLHHAVGKGCSKEVIDTIINHGADVNATNIYNTAALMIACKKGNIDTINVLLNAGANAHLADDDGDTCLHYAVDGECSKKVLETIISHGADANATNKENITVLMTSCVKGRTDLINVLLNAGANPNIADADGDTCMYTLCSFWRL